MCETTSDREVIVAKVKAKKPTKGKAKVQAEDIPMKVKNVVGVKSTSNAADVTPFLGEDEFRRSHGLPDEEPLYD